MDQPTHIKNEIAALIRRSDQSRARITIATNSLQRKLDVPSRIGNFVRSNPAPIAGASILTGLAATFIFRPRKRPAKTAQLKKRGIIASLLLLLLGAAKPFAKIYLSKIFKDYFNQHLNSASITHRPKQNPFHNQ